jgi:phosphatidylglycerol:prolipoprotein diacylglycerol transferase
MLTYPAIDPVAVAIGPLKVHWYGLMYVIGIATTWILARRRVQRSPNPLFTPAQVEDLVFYAAIGVVVGGRVGYALFYNFSGFLHDPVMLFRIWEGGMAFHGGLIGVLIAMYTYGRSQGIRFFDVADFLAPYVPIGLLAGRIGNFINGELWGKPSDVPWAMVFPNGGDVPRHPSQLYEAFLEGLVLLVILQWFSLRSPPRMAVSGMFLLGYGAFRFAVEFVRLPDVQLGYLAFGWLTMGQILCLPMILFGIVLLAAAYARRSA